MDANVDSSLASLDAAAHDASDGDADTAGPSCDDREAAGRALAESFQQCESDEDCVLAGGVGCLYLCYAAFNPEAEPNDLDGELRRSTAEWTEAYVAAGCPCAMADCADPSSLVARCGAGLCQVERAD